VKRIAALLGKELADLRGNPAVFMPAIITGVISIVMPFIIAIAVPYFSGERLADSSDFKIAVEMYRTMDMRFWLEQAEAAVSRF